MFSYRGDQLAGLKGVTALKMELDVLIDRSTHVRHKEGFWSGRCIAAGACFIYQMLVFFFYLVSIWK